MPAALQVENNKKRIKTRSRDYTWTGLWFRKGFPNRATDLEAPACVYGWVYVTLLDGSEAHEASLLNDSLPVNQSTAQLRVTPRAVASSSSSGNSTPVRPADYRVFVSSKDFSSLCIPYHRFCCMGSSKNIKSSMKYAETSIPLNHLKNLIAEYSWLHTAIPLQNLCSAESVPSQMPW